MTVTGTATESRSGRAFAFVRGATGPLIGLVLLCVFLSFSTDTFLSMRNFLNVMDQITVLGVMAVGMTLVILIGGIDLSVGSVLALSGMVMGYLGNNREWPFVIAILVALIASAACGLTSGLMVTRLRMPAFIATLAMMSIARGIASIITNGEQIVGFPGLVLQSRDHPPFRLSDRDGRLDGRHHRHRVDRAFLSSSRAGALRHRRQPGSRAARRHSGPPIHDVGLRHMRARSRASQASFFQPGSTRRSRAPASATNWTRSRRSSSEARAFRAASAASAARPSAS